MKIEGAIAKLSEDRLRHDHRCREPDQPGPAQHLGAEGVERGGADGRYHRKMRIVTKQHVRQRALLDLARQQNDRIEHRGSKVAGGPMSVSAVPTSRCA